jgi:hypothetical protein
MSLAIYSHTHIISEIGQREYLLNKAGEAGARIGAPRSESPKHAAQGMIGANSEPGEAPWGEAP